MKNVQISKYTLYMGLNNDHVLHMVHVQREHKRTSVQIEYSDKEGKRLFQKSFLFRNKRRNKTGIFSIFLRVCRLCTNTPVFVLYVNLLIARVGCIFVMIYLVLILISLQFSKTKMHKVCVYTICYRILLWPVVL